MANRRMFSLKIVSSDAFLDMPISSRELYFQLGMYADDDGFINPKKIIRMIGASDDDLKVLIAKRFVLPFENGVVVIKHWLINNLIRKDFYQETVYLEEKKALHIKENRAYTENVNNLLTQYSIGKVSIGKVNNTSSKEEGDKVPENKIIKKNNSSYGNPQVNQLIEFLKAELELSVLDDSSQVNRRYAYLCLKKFGFETIKEIIKKAKSDNFWSTKITGFKTIYYNGVKIQKLNNNQIVKI